MKVEEIRIIDVNGKNIVDINSKAILLEIKDRFIDVSYIGYSGYRRHVLIPSTNISQVLYRE